MRCDIAQRLLISVNALSPTVMQFSDCSSKKRIVTSASSTKTPWRSETLLPRMVIRPALTWPDALDMTRRYTVSLSAQAADIKRRKKRYETSLWVCRNFWLDDAVPTTAAVRRRSGRYQMSVHNGGGADSVYVSTGQSRPGGAAIGIERRPAAPRRATNAISPTAPRRDADPPTAAA